MAQPVVEPLVGALVAPYTCTLLSVLRPLRRNLSPSPSRFPSRQKKRAAASTPTHTAHTLVRAPYPLRTPCYLPTLSRTRELPQQQPTLRRCSAPCFSRCRSSSRWSASGATPPRLAAPPRSRPRRRRYRGDRGDIGVMKENEIEAAQDALLPRPSHPGPPTQALPPRAPEPDRHGPSLPRRPRPHPGPQPQL